MSLSWGHLGSPAFTRAASRSVTGSRLARARMAALARVRDGATTIAIVPVTHYSGRFRNQLWLAGWEYPKHLGWRPGTWRVSCVWRVPGLECLQRGGAWTTASLSPRWEGHRWPTAAATVQTRSLVEGAIGDRQSRPAANEICRELRQSWPAGLERYRTRSLLGEEGGQHAWQYSRHGPRDVRRTGREG